MCDQFGSQYSVKFNATKSKSMQFAAWGRVKRHLASRPDFCISGYSIKYVDKYVHLGHVISSDLSREATPVHNFRPRGFGGIKSQPRGPGAPRG